MKIVSIKVVPNDSYYELALAVEDEGQTYTATGNGQTAEAALERAIGRVMRAVADRLTNSVQFYVDARFDINR